MCIRTMYVLKQGCISKPGRCGAASAQTGQLTIACCLHAATGIASACGQPRHASERAFVSDAVSSLIAGTVSTIVNSALKAKPVYRRSRGESATPVLGPDGSLATDPRHSGQSTYSTFLNVAR